MLNKDICTKCRVPHWHGDIYKRKLWGCPARWESNNGRMIRGSSPPPKGCLHLFEQLLAGAGAPEET